MLLLLAGSQQQKDCSTIEGNPIFLRFSLNVIGIVKSVEIIKDENNKIKRIIHAEFIHPAINLMKIKIRFNRWMM